MSPHCYRSSQVLYRLSSAAAGARLVVIQHLDGIQRVRVMTSRHERIPPLYMFQVNVDTAQTLAGISLNFILVLVGTGRVSIVYSLGITNDIDAPLSSFVMTGAVIEMAWGSWVTTGAVIAMAYVRSRLRVDD